MTCRQALDLPESLHNGHQYVQHRNNQNLVTFDSCLLQFCEICYLNIVPQQCGQRWETNLILPRLHWLTTSGLADRVGLDIWLGWQE